MKTLLQVPDKRKVKFTYSSALNESLKTRFPNLLSIMLVLWPGKVGTTACILSNSRFPKKKKNPHYRIDQNYQQKQVRRWTHIYGFSFLQILHCTPFNGLLKRKTALNYQICGIAILNTPLMHCSIYIHSYLFNKS